MLQARSLRKRFRNASTAAVDDVSFAIDGARTLCVVGPSGAGKSTLLRMLAGLERVDGGTVTLNGRDVTQLPPQTRRIAMVFQDAALVPHMPVEANLRFALPRGADVAAVRDVARTMHVEHCLARRPAALSGGERQRVAIGRALLSDPLALLLDEPLAHVDPSLRAKIRDDVVRVRERFAGPIVYVTHDHAEAMAVADVLAVIIQGRLEQIGDPQMVYDRPANLRVARFLGVPAMNLLHGAGEMFGNPNAIVAVRPENVAVRDGGALRGKVVRCVRTGADAYAHVATPYGEVVARVAPSDPPRSGSDVALEFLRERTHCYDPTTEELIA